MRFSSFGVFLVVALAALAPGQSAQAQPPGGRGQGMMGGGMMGPMAGLAVLGTPEGQKELNITEEQKTKLATLQESTRATMMERFQSLQDVPQDERRAKGETLMREVADGMKKDVKAILDPTQYTRFEQITIQAMGFTAFNQPDVQKALKFTADQKSKIEAMQGANMTAMREAFQSNQGDQEAIRKAMTEIRDKSMEKAKALLTDDQKKAWAELIGKPFAMPQIGPGGPGGRRPAN
jgi:hypothetical protein